MRIGGGGVWVKVDCDEVGPQDAEQGGGGEHEDTHIVFRSWCTHCARRRGKEEACKKRMRELEQYEVHIDFMSMGEEGAEGTLCMMVAKERMTKAVMATVALGKSSCEWLAKRLMALMRDIGCETDMITMTSDNEPAIRKVIEEAGELRAAKGGRGGMAVRNSPVHSIKSN